MCIFEHLFCVFASVPSQCGSLCVCACTRLYLCFCVCVFVRFICAFTDLHIPVFVHLYVHVCIHSCVCVYFVWVYVCVNACESWIQRDSMTSHWSCAEEEEKKKVVCNFLGFLLDVWQDALSFFAFKCMCLLCVRVCEYVWNSCWTNCKIYRGETERGLHEQRIDRHRSALRRSWQRERIRCSRRHRWASPQVFPGLHHNS